MPACLIQIDNVSKSFGGVRAVSGVSFDIAGGEIHALMGENGAGKSTLMKILAGVHRPDTGRILLGGAEVHLNSPTSALKRGIALIHQEPLSFPDLSVAENIYLARGTPRGRLGQIDWRAMRQGARSWLSSLGVEMDVSRPMHGLSIADQQMVELAAALSQKARVLLMDEPTAALTSREADRLFNIVRKLREAGTAIVFISHRLEEVFALCDRITVMRDGQYVGTTHTSASSTAEIIRMMVGREVQSLYEKPGVPIGKTLLNVSDLGVDGKFTGVSFDVKAGEIVALAGLVGAGRTDVARCIFGLSPAQRGTIEIDGKVESIRSPRAATQLGIAYVPEDRRQHGLLLPMSIAANTSLADLSQVSSLGWIASRRERTLAEEWKLRLRTRLRDVSQPAGDLSGGNQQKVVLAKWLSTDPRILIVDEPTRGIDIGAKIEVHRLLAELAGKGKAIVMISSDLPEVLAMADRVVVMREGRMTALLDRAQATQESVMAAATGMSSRPPAAIQSAASTDPAAAIHPATGAVHSGAVQSGAAQTGPTPTDTAPVRGRRTISTLARLMQFRELGVAGFVLIAFALITWKEKRFASPENLRSVMMYLPLLLIVAMGQLPAILSRNIDLSVGAMLGFSAMVVGTLFRGHAEAPLMLAVLLGIGVGAILGAINGLLIAMLRVPAIIATLGTLTAYRGLIYIYAQWMGKLQNRGLQIDRNDIPVRLRDLSLQGPLDVPWIVIIAALVAVATWLLLRYARLGRAVYALGSSPHAAELRGIPVARTQMLIFTFSGALCGLAGFLFASRFTTVNANSVGQSMELQSISAVVIGGAAVNGGAGTVLGTLLGCLMLGVVNTALPMLHVSPFWEMAVYGAAIIIAVWISTVLSRRSGAGDIE